MKKDCAIRYDVIKWVLSVFCFVLSLYLNYRFSAVALPFKIIAWMLIFAGLGAILAFTTQGKHAISLLKEAKSELYRVSWPSRQETVQMTVMIAVMVMVAGLILSGLDAFLLWLMTWFTT